MSDKIKVKILEESSDKTGYPEKISITYLGKTIEVIKKNIEAVLGMDLANEGISLTPLEYINEVRERLAKTEIVDPDEKKKKKKEKKVKKEKTEEEKEASKIKIKKIFVRGIIGVLLASGIIWLISFLRGRGQDTYVEGNERGDDNNIPRQEQQVDPATLEPIETAAPVISEASPIEHEEYLKYVNRSSSDLIAMSDEDYLLALNSQTIACQMNMPEISLFLEGNALEGTKQLSYIQNTFIPGSADYCIVEHFNQYRNDLVSATYNMQSRPATEAMLRGHLTEIYLFCNNQYGVTVDTSNGPQTFYWNNMSDEARNAILDVLFAFTGALPHDCVLEINGVKMTPQDFGTFYESELARLILVNPTVRK